MSASASRKPSESLLRILAGLVGLVGLGIASYIMINEVRGELVACGREGGCETVLNSKYAEIFGVPLYYFGVVGYISILGATALLTVTAADCSPSCSPSSASGSAPT